MYQDISQQKAIEASGGHHLVLAPPGCGKTDILARRIAWAHSQGVAYGDMICLTFTNRAARGMQERVCSLSGEPVPGDLFVGNVHRLCAQYLFENGVLPRHSAVIDEGDVDSIVRGLWKEKFPSANELQVNVPRVAQLQHCMRQWADGVSAETGLHEEMRKQYLPVLDLLRKASGRDIGEIYENIEELYLRAEDPIYGENLRYLRMARAYEVYKQEYDMLDFDDLLIVCLQELSAGGDHRRYRWIQVDEVQDLNPTQLAIIDCLTAEDATVVYLGDEQQAIFSFIGAKMETLEVLKRRCYGNIHRLERNYRSPKYLLDVMNAYAVWELNISPQMLPQAFHEEPGGEGMLNLITVPDIGQSYTATVQEALRLAREDDGRVALLVPYNRHADCLSEQLEALKIPHFKISGSDLFASPVVQALFAHLNIAQGEGGFTSWAKLLFHTGIVPQYTEARDFMREMRRCGMLPTDFIYYEESSYLAEFARVYEEEELVIFDTETTGLDVREDEIIQIAAIKVRKGERVPGSEFNIFLEITKEIPPVLKGDRVNPMVEAYAVHPHETRAAGLKKFLDYCKGCLLVGHNVEYDYHILKYNLRRDLPEVELEHLHPERYDTLKYIRLIEPRLRHYNLERLLVQLNLEGENSHRADDDILATWELLKYCHDHSNVWLERQKQLCLTPRVKSIASRIREHYGPLYSATQSRLYEESVPESEEPVLVTELQRCYEFMTTNMGLNPIRKFHYVKDYLSQELIQPAGYPTLKSQLERYMGDLMTLKESDLCGSSVVGERFFISTVHKAKGLEFDSVVVFGASNEYYPTPRNYGTGQKQEDARKLYVALSRARKRLSIVCPQNMSPFLTSIQDYFLSGNPLPETPEALYRQGARLRKLGHIQEAIPYFQQVISAQPGHQQAQRQMADLTKTFIKKGRDFTVDWQQAGAPGSLGKVEIIESQPSKTSDEGQKAIWIIDKYYEKSDGYPLAVMPQFGCAVTYPRRGRSRVHQWLGVGFYNYLKSHLAGVHVSNECHIAVPCSRKAIEPEIIAFDLTRNLLIDIEIDAPYDGIYRFPTHTIEDIRDLRRDRSMAAMGWMVVRFSERQIRYQPEECLQYLQDIITSASNEQSLRFNLLAAEPRWNFSQALHWEQEHYREQYLGIESFEPYDFSSRILVNQPIGELTFDEASHIYAPQHNPNGGADYISVTTLIGRFFPFDTETLIAQKVRKEHRPEDEIRAELEHIQQDASGRGTELHAAIEHFLKGEPSEPYNAPEWDYFLQFHKDILLPYLDYVDAERMISLPDYGVAGTVDALFRRKRDGAYIMVDWKRSRQLIIGDGKIKKYGIGRGLSIMGHLDDSSYYHYELQQSFYKYILEKQYGIHVEEMMLCVLHPTYDRYYTIRLENYRKREVEALLESLQVN